MNQKNSQFALWVQNKTYHSAEAILNKCNNVINKIDSSPPEVIYSIALKSSLIISNDTGPAHIASLLIKILFGY